jgi:hypothetical protein
MACPAVPVKKLEFSVPGEYVDINHSVRSEEIGMFCTLLGLAGWLEQ